MKTAPNAPFDPVPGVLGKAQNGQHAVLGKKGKAKTAQHAVSGQKAKGKMARHAVSGEKPKAKTAQHAVPGRKVKAETARHAVPGEKAKGKTGQHRVLRCFGFPFLAQHRSFPRFNCAQMAHCAGSRRWGRRGDGDPLSNPTPSFAFIRVIRGQLWKIERLKSG